jgi:hypothetical protein
MPGAFEFDATRGRERSGAGQPATTILFSFPLEGRRLWWGRLQPKSAARVSTFCDCIEPDPYQGTTSVVPMITAGVRALAPVQPYFVRLDKLKLVRGTTEVVP